MRRLLILSVFALATGCSRMAAPEAPATPTIPFEKYTLPNGLDVILSEDHRLPIVSVDVWYHVGPANEAAGRTGFAHLFEHMMFQESKHVAQDTYFKRLEAAGATNVNGTTSFDRTNYFETLPANQLELGLWLESDRMGYLLDTLDEKGFTNQQDVVRNERRQSVENQPYGIVNDALFQALFPKGHPYYANVIGSHADIQAAKLEDVKAFFKQYYAPNNASLTIAGDFDKTQVKNLVTKYFGSFKRGPEVPKVTVTTPPITAEKRLVVKDRVQLPRVFMAWITPPFFKPGDSEADVTANILGGGDYSRLYKTLVYEKQLAQDVTAFQFSLSLGSTFQIVATVRPGHTPDEVAAAIDQELEAFKNSGPDQKEVERARNVFETQLLGGLEVTGGFGGVADTLNMFNHYLGDPGYLPKYLDEHRKITPAAIKTFAQTYLKKDARVVVYGVAGQPDFGAPVPTPPPSKAKAGAGAESVNADEAWRATQPAAGPVRDVKLPVPTTFILGNGLKVMYLERPGLPVVAAELVIGSGGDTNPNGRSGLANYTASMLNQGTASRNALGLANDVAQLGASLSASSTKDAMSVSLRSLKTNLPAALDLMADVALRPSFPKEEVERQRTSRLASLLAQRQDPSTIATTVMVNALYGNSHPYGYIELGNEAAVRATVREDMEAFWKKTFVPENAALIVSGAIGEAELKPLVEKAFGGWKATTPGNPQRPDAAGLGNVPPPPAAKVFMVDTPGAPQTYIATASIGAAFSTPDHEAAEVMNSVLGGLFSSRINLNLREAHGYTYGAFSQFLFRKAPGPFWAQSGVRTDVTGPAVQELLKEIDRMRSSPMSAEELAMGKDSLIRALPGNFETNGETVGQFANIFVYGLEPDYYAKYTGRVTAVTADTALAAAKKYLVPEKMIVVLVGDRAKITPQISKLNLGSVQIRDADGNPKK